MFFPNSYLGQASQGRGLALGWPGLSWAIIITNNVMEREMGIRSRTQFHQSWGRDRGQDKRLCSWRIGRTLVSHFVKVSLVSSFAPLLPLLPFCTLFLFFVVYHFETSNAMLVDDSFSKLVLAATVCLLGLSVAKLA